MEMFGFVAVSGSEYMTAGEAGTFAEVPVEGSKGVREVSTREI